MDNEKLITNNKLYASKLTSKDLDLPIPPDKRIVILTCMDARLEPLYSMGLSIGDAHVIRNAGGRASDDAIRSLIISYKLLGTKYCFVIHHTNCGMETFTNDTMISLLGKSLDTAVLTEDGWKDNGSGYERGTDAKYINFLTISDLEDSVREDIQRIKNHPLVPNTLDVRGFIHDVKTGLLNEIK